MPSNRSTDACRRLRAVQASLDDAPAEYSLPGPPWQRAWADRLSARERTGLTLEDEDRILDRVCAGLSGLPVAEYRRLLARKLARRNVLWSSIDEGVEP